MSRSCRKFENKHNNGSGRKKVNYDGKIILNKQIHNRLINLLSNLKIVGGSIAQKQKPVMIRVLFVMMVWCGV